MYINTERATSTMSRTCTNSL